MANLTRISRLGMVNAYLVREDDGFTVVDTMLLGAAKQIVREASGPPRRSSASSSPTPTGTTSARWTTSPGCSPGPR